MRRALVVIGLLAASSAQALASGSAYENAAKIEMEHLASSVLAASVCQGVRFNGNAAIPHIATAALLLGQKQAEDAFFSAMRAAIDAMSTNGRDMWCAATIKAAKDRKSDTLTQDDN